MNSILNNHEIKNLEYSTMNDIRNFMQLSNVAGEIKVYISEFLKPE